ncbi:putative gamma-glutamylcyclotransferase CG2811 [Teleopsis dalmanni]|uniref:putative gamma-glutamylcyclotransferase CG2811 n=1 Tax=Teleopsis dalmanni TaxID=139649 RepID=UPI0018CE2835|nr:putative gamma-glutamylcyclotransferase CG2811 [Teleopsis dalmanni]
MKRMLYNVFVYGTLKRGEPNHHWFRPENGFSRFIAAGSTTQKFPLIVGTRYNIPFLLDRPGIGYNIKGEIYEIDEAMLGKLDELEGYPQYYDREIQNITVENESMQCWLYLLRKFPEKILEKTLLEAYHNTPEQPYCESYVDSTVDDIFDSDDLKQQSN